MAPWLGTIVGGLGNLGSVFRGIGELLNSKLFLYACIAVTVFWVYAEKIDADYAARDAEATQQALRDKLKQTNEALKLIAEDASKAYEEREALNNSVRHLSKSYSDYVAEHTYEDFQKQMREDPQNTIKRTNTEYIELFDRIGKSFVGEVK